MMARVTQVVALVSLLVFLGTGCSVNGDGEAVTVELKLEYSEIMDSVGDVIGTGIGNALAQPIDVDIIEELQNLDGELEQANEETENAAE